MAELSLGPVLDLIERWQHGDAQAQSDALYALLQIDTIMLRALCEQHAAQLREHSEDCDVGGKCCKDCKEIAVTAAEFLAPRCKQEEE